jgi:hypothetical protein
MSRKSKPLSSSDFWIAPNFSMSKARVKPPATFGAKTDPEAPGAEDDRSLARFLELADIALKDEQS